jgi:hypothetical protein
MLGDYGLGCPIVQVYNQDKRRSRFACHFNPLFVAPNNPSSVAVGVCRKPSDKLKPRRNPENIDKTEAPRRQL